jgi:hypothetical protein
MEKKEGYVLLDMERSFWAWKLQEGPRLVWLFVLRDIHWDTNISRSNASSSKMLVWSILISSSMCPTLNRMHWLFDLLKPLILCIGGSISSKP